jgi:tetratricopeptide (TPR) repeat protein
VHELLSDIDDWQSRVRQARQDWQRAVAAVGNGPLVAGEIRERIRAVQAAVEREETAYGLANELDDIAVEAFESFDSRGSLQRKAVVEYERFFARQGLDIRAPGTVPFTSAIRSSPIRFALIAAIENWALLASYNKDPQVARLLELARAADPDPWRNRFRDPDVWADLAALTRLAEDDDVGRQSPAVLVSLAWLLSINGGDPTALFQRALLDHPRDFWLHQQAAISARNPGVKMGLALAAIAIRSRSAVAYCLLAYFLREQGNWSAALVAANRAIEINPNCATAYNYLGLALQDKKDLPAAVAALQTAVALDPGNSSPCWNLGDLFRHQGNAAAAADAYRKAAERLGTAAGFRKLGGYLRDLKDHPGCVTAFQRAIEVEPEDFLARHCLGEVLQMQGQYAEAEKALEPIKAQPTSVPGYESLARLLATCPDDKVRDGKRAVQYATIACERTGWKNPSCVDTLAAAYAEVGQFEEAARYQTRALDDPGLKSDLRAAATQRLELYRKRKPLREHRP